MTGPASKRAILVLGPHRSGTSLVANSLHAAGFNLGADPLAPNEENPKGFFESKKVVSLNDELLAELDLCWDYVGIFGLKGKAQALYDSTARQRQATEILQTVFSNDGRIAIKDPRLCILEPFWTRALEGNGFSVAHVLVLRHPLESALSQAVRYNAEKSVHVIGDSITEGVQLWASYMLEALDNLRAKQPCLVDYASVLRAPNQQIAALYAALDIPAQRSNDVGGDIADASLKRNDASSLKYADQRSFRKYIAVYSTLARAANRKPRVGAVRLAYAHAKLKLAMSDDSQLPATQRRLYVRARNQAIGRGVQLHNSQQELARAGNIIRFNENLIEELRSKLNVTGERNTE